MKGAILQPMKQGGRWSALPECQVGVTSTPNEHLGTHRACTLPWTQVSVDLIQLPTYVSKKSAWDMNLQPFLITIWCKSMRQVGIGGMLSLGSTELFVKSR